MLGVEVVQNSMLIVRVCQIIPVLLTNLGRSTKLYIALSSKHYAKGIIQVSFSELLITSY